MGIHPSVYVVCTFAFAAVSGYVDDYSRVLGLEQLSRSGTVTIFFSINALIMLICPYLKYCGEGDPGKNVHDRQRLVA